jgi:hypothetical protein
MLSCGVEKRDGEHKREETGCEGGGTEDKTRNKTLCGFLLGGFHRRPYAWAKRLAQSNTKTRGKAHVHADVPFLPVRYAST